jgi:hypothetical protein
LKRSTRGCPLSSKSHRDGGGDCESDDLKIGGTGVGGTGVGGGDGTGGGARGSRGSRGPLSFNRVLFLGSRGPPSSHRVLFVLECGFIYDLFNGKKI